MGDQKESMSFRLCTLASGSEGNVSFAEYRNTRVLIDAGLSYRALCGFLSEIGVAPESIDAVLLTHEHRDHTVGLPMLLKKLSLPVYTTPGTFEGLSEQKLFERIPKAAFHLIADRASLVIGDLTIRTIPIQHDARDPVAFRLDGETVHFAVMTDLGNFNEDQTESLKGLDALILEANHNRNMLETGPYPYPLKLRIDSDRGHLSNEAAASLLRKIWHPGLKAVLLSHLSRTNNYPLLAQETVRQMMEETDQVGSMKIYVAPPRGLSDIITF